MKLKETNNSWTNEKPPLLEWTLMSLKTRRKLKLTLQNTPSSWHQIHLWSTDRLANLLWAIQVMTPCKSYVLEWRQRSNCKIMIHPWKITDVCVRSGIRNTLISIILMFWNIYKHWRYKHDKVLRLNLIEKSFNQMPIFSWGGEKLRNWREEKLRKLDSSPKKSEKSEPSAAEYK